MKKGIISYLTYIATILPVAGIGGSMLTSCEDMFDPAKENHRTEEAMYEEANYAHGLLMYAYARLPYITTSQTDIATDDAVTNILSNSYKNMATGAWSVNSDPMTQWVNCKDGIQYANIFLKKVDDVKWAPSSGPKDKMFKMRLKGEAYTLRAILYYHLLQAHGGYDDEGNLLGVPLLTEPENAGSDFNQERASFAACVRQCFADCDSAIALLPTNYKDESDTLRIDEKYRKLGPDLSDYNLVLGNKARNLISGKVAEAVKAQVALLAISPAFREKSGVTFDEAAMICAAPLLRIQGVNGMDPLGHIWYANKGKLQDNGDVDEIIWRGDRSIDNTQEAANFPPSLSGSGQINPSQNLVDAFPTMNGYPKDDKRSGFNPDEPYANRDPRLSRYIIYHGTEFGPKGNKKLICTGYKISNGGAVNPYDDNIGETAKSTLTGYYLKKLLWEDMDISSGTIGTYYHFYPRIRFTEIFLAFAEAANEAWGPDAKTAPDTIKNMKLTPYEVIKAIRQRAGLCKDELGNPLPQGDAYLNECAKDKNLMRELIRNERRLELCFENKRFWDLRRWLLPLDEPVRGVNITEEDGKLIYTPIDEVEKREFDNSYQHYGPIPQAEILKWSKLKQNKGWKN